MTVSLVNAVEFLKPILHFDAILKIIKNNSLLYFTFPMFVESLKEIMRVEKENNSSKEP